MRIYSIFLICFGLFCSNTLFAQIDYNEKYGGTSKTNTDSLSTSNADFAPDTFNFQFFYPANPEVEIDYQDTTIHHFQNHDPVRQQKWDYGSTGNLGSAHFPFVYQAPVRRGFDVGFRQFDLYKIHYDQFVYYRLRKAFTKLNFTQGDTQQDTYTQAKFSRNFAKGINLALDFKRINHKGHYQTQTSENTSLAIGLWYKSPNNRYDAFITYVSNAVFQNENGGINQAGVNSENIKDAFAIPVILGTDVANTAHTDRAIHYQHRFLFNKQKASRKKKPKYYPPLIGNDSLALNNDSISTNTDSLLLAIDTTTISKDSLLLSIDSIILNIDSLQTNIDTSLLSVDSISSNRDSLSRSYSLVNKYEQKLQDPSFKKRKRDFAFSHHGEFQVAKYKFSDASPAADSSFYGALQIDNRGLRYFIRDRKLENSFTLNTSKLQQGKGLTDNKQKDFFEVGIRHTFHFIHQEPKDTVINNLFLQGRWNFSPGERLKIHTYADLGLIDNAGDYRLSGDLFFDLKNAGQIKARAVHQSYAPTLLQYRHIVSQQILWENNLEKTFETNISLSYALPRFKLELVGAYHLLDHFIFYNADAVPEQYNSPLSIGQLTITKELRFRRIFLENSVTLQQISKNVIRLPELYSRHSLYFDGKIFKRILNIRIGADLRINNPYEAEGYQPLTGQFYLQEYAEDEDPEWYPDIDAFINFRVKNFRFFVKQENVFGFFTDDFHYQVKNYPLPYPYLRFGVSWQFMD